jgi:type IV secretion system protein VirB10
MATAPPGDPRINGTENSVTPVVAAPRGGPSWIVIAIGMAILGVLLFTLLDARRRSITAPAVKPTASDRALAAGTGTVAPTLYVPPEPAPVEPPVQVIQQQPIPLPMPPQQPQIIYVPQPMPPQPMPQPAQPAPRTNADATVVVDNTQGDAPQVASAGAAPSQGGEGGVSASPSIAGGRVRAAQLANRSTTVPQGTLIPAVLETGFDSTRPGLARAMVTKDVRGFDGKKILIPRGSRLIGEYKSENNPGQNRARIDWLRLIRPDGATIAIGSPSGDPLGRGGVKAKVNNHFFQKFSGAILQSMLDIGVNIASQELSSSRSPVIVALPGTLQQSTQALGQQQQQQITPTLKVRPGTSITIFAARDLDFTGADARQ